MPIFNWITAVLLFIMAMAIATYILLECISKYVNQMDTIAVRIQNTAKEGQRILWPKMHPSDIQ